MECSHVTAAALDAERLVRDDRDRWELRHRLAAVLAPGGLLAHCFMDTHAHVVVEGSAARARELARHALSGYVRCFNARHGRSGPLLRGPVEATTARSPRELARQIVYVHENPLRTREPIVAEALHFESSSARAFAGLSRAPGTNVARALTLLGDERRRVVRRAHPLADLTPSPFPAGGVDLVLSAAAQTFGDARHDRALSRARRDRGARRLRRARAPRGLPRRSSRGSARTHATARHSDRRWPRRSHRRADRPDAPPGACPARPARAPGLASTP